MRPSAKSIDTYEQKENGTREKKKKTFIEIQMETQIKRKKKLDIYHSFMMMTNEW